MTTKSQKGTGAGLAVLLLAFGLLWAFKGKEEANGGGGNGGGEQPENGQGQPDFYMPPELQCTYTGPVNGYYRVTFSTDITNRGDAPGTYQLTWGTNELHPVTSADEFEVEGSQVVTLQPGETHHWEQTWTEIFDYYLGYFKCWLFGAWSPNIPAVGVFQ